MSPAWCGRWQSRTRNRSSSGRFSSEWIHMADAPSANAPTFNFKQAITQMVQRNASDLLLKVGRPATIRVNGRSEEHTSELQSQSNLVCRLLLEKKKKKVNVHTTRYRVR